MYVRWMPDRNDIKEISYCTVRSCQYAYGLLYFGWREIIYSDKAVSLMVQSA